MFVRNGSFLLGCLMAALFVAACNDTGGNQVVKNKNKVVVKLGEGCTTTSECKDADKGKVACLDNGSKKLCTSVCVDKSDCSGTDVCRPKGKDVDGKGVKQCTALVSVPVGAPCTSDDECQDNGVCSKGATGKLTPRCVPRCTYEGDNVDAQCHPPGDYPVCSPEVETVDGSHESACDVCDFRHAINRVNSKIEYGYWIFAKPNPNLDAQPQPVCDTHGLCKITDIVNGAYLISSVDDRSLIYLDMDTNKYLKISDEEAIKVNKDWDVGFGAWSLLTNGGQLPGNIKVTIVQGDQTAFENYSLAKAKAIPDGDFIDEDLIDVPNCIMKEYKPDGGGQLVPQAVDRLMTRLPDTFYKNMVYRYSVMDHLPHVQPGIFFVLKDTKRPNWYAKMKMDDIHVDSNHHLSHTFSYGLLK